MFEVMIFRRILIGFRVEGLRLKVLTSLVIFFFLQLTFFQAFAQNDSTKNSYRGNRNDTIYEGIPKITKEQIDASRLVPLSQLLQGRIVGIKEDSSQQTNLKPQIPNSKLLIPNSDSSNRKSYFVNPKSRIRLVTTANILGYGGAMIGLYSAWYSGYPQTKFHFFNDNKEWLQVDKVGHMYSAYVESKASMELWRWAGLSDKKRIWIGGLSGAAYQTVIETLDGFSEGWGWSWGDFTANCIGSGILVGQEFLWKEQRVDVKFSFHTVNYTEPMLHQRADSLYGKSFMNRMIKDYNGQTYWLSANLKSFFPKSNIPAWLNIAVGYGADGMFGAEDNTWKDKNGNLINRNDIARYRQWYIAPDINLMKIKTKNKLVKTALFFFNSFKFPMPSVGFSKNGVEFNWLHF